MREELKVLLKRFQDSPDIEAIVLTGSGERAFCAGQDLNETKDFDPDGIEAWMREWEVMYACIRGLEKPFVIALNGLAAGSAVQLALSAYFRIDRSCVLQGQRCQD